MFINQISREFIFVPICGEFETDNFFQNFLNSICLPICILR